MEKHYYCRICHSLLDKAVPFYNEKRKEVIFVCKKHKSDLTHPIPAESRLYADIIEDKYTQEIESNIPPEQRLAE